jgi:hypothetical protein
MCIHCDFVFLFLFAGDQMHPLVQKFYDETGWKDKCLLLEIIHIKMKQSRRGRWRIKDTAKMLKLSVGLVSEDLQLARALTNEVLSSNVKSRNQAIKQIRGK